MLGSYRSRFTLWIIEVIISLNMIYLSAVPLLRGYRSAPDETGVVGRVEYVLTGTGGDTVALWLRLLGIVAGLTLLFLWPRKNSSKFALNLRSAVNLTMTCLFLFVVFLQWTYGVFFDFLWVQAAVYAAIMGIAYISNSWWARND